MYTYDEWGNYVLHIQTGNAGAKILREMGFGNNMSKEEYAKHMDSYRRMKEKENEELKHWLESFMKWLEK